MCVPSGGGGATTARRLHDCERGVCPGGGMELQEPRLADGSSRSTDRRDHARSCLHLCFTGASHWFQMLCCIFAVDSDYWEPPQALAASPPPLAMAVLNLSEVPALAGAFKVESPSLLECLVQSTCMPTTLPVQMKGRARGKRLPTSER